MNIAVVDCAAQLLRDLQTMDVRLWREADRLCYRAPSGILTPDLLTRIRVMKPQILALLEHDPDRTGGAAPSAPNIVLLHASPGKPRVFCVHAVDGGVSPFLQLSRELAPAATTYGISVVDLVERIRLPDSITAIARYYVEQVLRLQESGPYVLVGWSSGGWIAFEIACELASRGHRIGGLVILDIGAPGRRHDLDPPPGSQELTLTPLQRHSACLWWRFLVLFNSHDIVVPAHFWTLSDQEKSRYLVEHRHDRSLFAKNCDLLAVRDAADLMFRFDMVNLQHDAIARYEPSAYTGPIQLFNASVDSKPPPVNELQFALNERFWKSATTGTVRSEYLSGGHRAPLSRPAVSKVAQCVLALSRTDDPS